MVSILTFRKDREEVRIVSTDESSNSRYGEESKSRVNRYVNRPVENATCSDGRLRTSTRCNFQDLRVLVEQDTPDSLSTLGRRFTRFRR